MRTQVRYRLLFLLSLPILALGCATARQQVAKRNDAPLPTQAHASPARLASPAVLHAESDDSTGALRTVAHQDIEVDHAADGGNGKSLQLAVPIAAESTSTTETGSGLTLDAIEQLALAHNPAIRQASAASARAGGIRTQVGTKPNPTVGYNGSQLADAGTDQNLLFVEQTFVRGDKLAWNQQVIDHDVNAMNWQVETQRQRVLTDIRMVFYDALVAQKRLQLSRDFRGVAKEGVSVSEERINAQVGTRPDVLQSEIQLNEVDLTIQQAEFELSAARAELTALVGVPDLGATSLVGELKATFTPRDAEAEFAQIVAVSPQLAAAQARVDRAQANLQRQKVQPIPNVTAQLGVGHDNGTGQEFANVQLSLPIPVHNKNEGNIHAAYAEYCAATQNVERIRMSIRQELARVMRDFQVAGATVRQYDEFILPRANETLELMREAQRAGEFDFLRVLTARRAYFDANLKYVEALGRLAQANAKLDGLLLTGGLSNVVSYDGGDDLRGQALSGQ